MHALMEFQRSGAYEKLNMGLTLKTRYVVLQKVGQSDLALLWRPRMVRCSIEGVSKVGILKI